MDGHMHQAPEHIGAVELSRIRVIGEKAADLAANGRRVVKLHVGEPDFETPERIRGAAIASLNRKETHYTHNRGTMELRTAVSRKLSAENGVTADPSSELLILNGCAEALFCATVGLLDVDDELIVIEPCFVNYVQLARICRAKPVVVQAREENGWLPDPADIRRAVTKRTRMLIINTPSNPTGAVYPRALLEAIAALAAEYGFIVVSDEVYEKLVYGQAEHVSIASLPGMEDRAVTINGFSKAYAMTGWRLGYLAAARTLTLAMLKVHQYTTTCLPAFVQAGAVEALRSGAAEVERMRLEYMRRRDIVTDLLDADPDIRLVRPQGTFYLFPNIAASGLSSAEFAARLLDAEGVASVPDTAFRSEGGTNIRLSFASDEESLRLGASKVRGLMASRCLA